MENQKKHGLENWYFIENFQLIWIYSGLMDMRWYGDEISIVLIKRLIWLDQRQMMEKSDFIHLSDRGSIVVNQRSGTISGERKILIQPRYILGGIRSLDLVNAMWVGELMLFGEMILYLQKLAI